MNFKDKRVILTGATGGIGSQIAQRLSAAGARLSLVDISSKALDKAVHRLGTDNTIGITADITTDEGRSNIVGQTMECFGGVDILINSAGINPFGSFVDQDPSTIEMTLAVNTIAPMLLTQKVLPDMLQRGNGHIVNIGSTFGSIAFAWFTAYSTSKFAMRGFSQALRRELVDTGVKVTYIAPRAVKTPINSDAVYDLAKVIKMNMDEPEDVARQIVNAVAREQKECYIGFPESLFVRINSVLPGLIDNSVRKQDQIAREYAMRK
jgi:short-subunit dehydrogenase